MNKNLKFLALTLAVAIMCTSCGTENDIISLDDTNVSESSTTTDSTGVTEQSLYSDYSKHSAQYLNYFDTVIQFIGYTKTSEDFEKYSLMAQSSFDNLNKLFDRFNQYEGINNIYTINQNAGIAPVEVDPCVVDLIQFCVDAYYETDGLVNISMGAVLDVWHDYMDTYSYDSSNSQLPPIETLESKNQLSVIENIVIDKENNTVFLTEEGMMLDVGGIAKGYATQIIADKIEEAGLESFTLNAGGNVVSKNQPYQEGRTSWNVGIQNPFEDLNDPRSGSINIVTLKTGAVVSSGDYQRFYMVDDQRVHHIIDPSTLMPANYYRGLTVVHPHSGYGDVYSTAMFCMDYETGKEFAEKNDLMVVWIFDDGSVEYTDNVLDSLIDPTIKNTSEYTKLYA